MLSLVVLVLVILLACIVANGLPIVHPFGNAIRWLSTVILVIILLEVLLPVFDHAHHYNFGN